MPPDRHLHCCRRLVPSWFTVGPAFTVGPELVQAARSDRYRSESGRALCWACVVLAMVGHARARARRPRSAPRSADRTLIEKFLEEVVDSLFALRSSVAAPGASPLTSWTLDLRPPRTRHWKVPTKESVPRPPAYVGLRWTRGRKVRRPRSEHEGPRSRDAGPAGSSRVSRGSESHSRS